VGKSKKPYKTPRSATRCVKYWDKAYKNKGYYFDWQVMKAVVESKIGEIKEDLNVNATMARKVSWNAYCAAIEGDEDNPLWEAYVDFMDVITDEDLPEFVMVQTIGSDLHAGHTEKEAKRAFVGWLKEDPENGKFGDYRITTRLTVIKD
jgi:hypothetical protein